MIARRTRPGFSLVASLAVVAPLNVAGALAGCSGSSPVVPEPRTSAASITGEVHGGQQPVAGAAIQLYAVGTTGDASAANAATGRSFRSLVRSMLA